MSNDVYTECLVKKVPTGADKAKRVLFLIGITVLCAFLLVMLGTLGLMLDAALLYGGFYLFTGMDHEYEYIFTNGALDVDRIMGQRKRKRLVSIDCDNVTAFGKLAEAQNAADSVTLVLASANNGDTDYYIDAKHKSAGNVRIIFTPNDKMIDSIGEFLPRTLRVEFTRKRKNEKAKEALGNENASDS